MKFLVLQGSPNCNGFGNYLINKIKQSLSAENIAIDLDIFYVGKTKYKLCEGCNRCFIDGKCKLTNVDNYDFSKKLTEYDGIVLLAPSYVRQMPAILKNCFDRMAHIMHEFPLLGRKVVLISYSNSNGEKDLAVYLNKLFNLLGTEVIKTIAFNRLFGNEDELINNIKESLIIMKEKIEKNQFTVTKSQEEIFLYIKNIVNNEIQNNIVTYKHKRWKKLLQYNSLVEYLRHNKIG